MAERILFNIAGEILLKLGSQALSELGTYWGVNDEIDNLKNTVSTIQAVLRDAEEQPVQSNETKDWIAKLKDAFYDVDDLLDDLSTEAKRREDIKCNKVAKEVGLFFSRSNKLVYDFRMGHRIKAIREKLETISKNRRDLHSVSHQTPSPSTNILRGRDQTYSYVIEEKVIGRENDKIDIVGRLLNSDPEENVSVVPIVGFGGLGKTTLAQLVYNDGQVKSTFNLRMWVSVSDASDSDVFDVKLIVEKIIKSATNRDPIELESDSTVPDRKRAFARLFAVSRVAKSLDLEQLQVLMRKEIEGKKYLLVLDDVWNVDVGKWSSLKDLLSCGGRGSRIIVTTRSESVAKIVTTLPPHMLKGLPTDQSWSLFLRVVFNGKEPENKAAVEVGKKIVERCGGVPLAICSIGGLLRPINPETWSSFLEIEFSKIGEENKILSTLRLSYNHLPSQLKHCFAYCALLPKDKEIDVQALIRLWIAEGSIWSYNSNQCLEDIGLWCFRELLWRSFFQEVEFDEFGNECTCRMHSFMHDLARFVARTEIHAIGSGTEPVDSKTRHLSLHLNSNSIPTHLLKAKRLRTLLLTAGGVDGSQKDSMIGDVCRTYGYLRALNVRQSGFDKVPSSIRKLKHIRYLDLSGNNFMLLSESITKLRNLEVLKLSNCEYLLALPEKTSKLVNLKHLDCEGCDSLFFMPRGLGQLTSLQTLNFFEVDGTSRLTDWVAQECGLNECLVSCCIRSFAAWIAMAMGRWSVADFFLRRFANPRHVGGLNELRGLNNLRGELKITNLGLVENAVSEFQAANLKGKQHLQSLVLIWNAEDLILDGDSVERSFEYLEPHPNLKKLEVREYEGGRFPSWLQNLTSLQQLKLRDCPRLASLPQGMHGLTSLQKLEISGCDELKERCKHNKAADWHIIGHIANIVIDGQDIQRDGQYLSEDEGSSTATADAEVKEEQTKSEAP